VPSLARREKTWNVVCRRGHAKRRHTLGTYPETSLVEAREQAGDKIREFRRSDQLQRSRRLSFRDLAMQYLEEHAKRKKVSGDRTKSASTGSCSPRLATYAPLTSIARW
jgi:hypothetical protein